MIIDMSNLTFNGLEHFNSFFLFFNSIVSALRLAKPKKKKTKKQNRRISRFHFVAISFHSKKKAEGTYNNNNNNNKKEKKTAKIRIHIRLTDLFILPCCRKKEKKSEE